MLEAAIIAFNRSKAKLYTPKTSRGQYEQAVAESDAAWRILQQAAIGGTWDLIHGTK